MRKLPLFRPFTCGFCFLFLFLSGMLCAQGTSPLPWQNYSAGPSSDVPERCAADQILQEALDADPTLRDRLDQQEAELQAIIRELRDGTRNNDVVLTIPVVFHVVHDGDPIGTNENISDQLILANLAQLNADFRLMNSDAGNTPPEFPTADTKIEFCLATVDPQGMPTTGIVRHQQTEESFSSTALRNYGASIIWDRDQYMNVVIANLPDVLGFSTFPGSGIANEDANYLTYYCVGSIDQPNPAGGVYDSGRTLTHEVGHWLNLRHIWGDGDCSQDDLVADTPTQSGYNTGCPTHPKVSCGTNDMFMNYMDYSDDACLLAFTPGQRNRMRATLLGGFRSSLLCSSLCGALPAAATTDNDGDGVSLCQGDCDDNNDQIFPGAPELCNGIDDNCDGQIDEDIIGSYYIDSDSDGYGTGTALVTCSPPDGYVLLNGDCDDNNNLVFPGAVDFCDGDGLDNDCDGQVDEDPPRPYYLDADSDGYGTGTALISCLPPDGYVLLNGDCDDTNENISPGAIDICNGIDDNCDGIVDDGKAHFTSSDVPVSILDNTSVTSTLTVSNYTGTIQDLDLANLRIHHTYISDLRATLASPQNTVVELFIKSTCSQNHLLVTFDDEATLSATQFNATCNTSDGTVGPPYAIEGTYQPEQALSAFDGESPNGIWTLTLYDDLTGDVGSLENWELTFNTPITPLSNPTLYYPDTDGDGFGDANATGDELSCAPDASLNLVDNNTDCDDDEATIFPNAPEICDGIDNNCDGFVDNNASCCPGGNTIYVDRAANGTNTGASWTNAYTNLQSALELAEICGASQIWVAQGTYRPTTNASDRTASFILREGVALYGGFLGTETQLDQRDWRNHPTILSGDLNNDDGANFANTDDNSYSVILNNNNGLTAAAVLDGFIISGGNANGSSGLTNGNGGGMANANSSPSIRNCLFRNNQALASGGGLWHWGEGVTSLLNCSFIGNRSVQSTGGAISGASISGTYSFSATNCLFSGNRATLSGGAVSLTSATTTLTNCTFSGNQSGLFGGALYLAIPPSVTVTNTIIHNNRAFDNQNNADASIYDNSNTVSWDIKHSLVQHITQLNDGNFNLAGTTDPLFVQPVDPMTAPTTAGDLRLQTGSPALDAGDNKANNEPWDMLGNARLQNGIIDLGAMEGIAAALPVELLDFSGKATERGNELTWETALEENLDYFQLERSADGRTFAPLGEVLANNTPTRYDHLDADPPALAYYRLRTVELDGVESLSPVIVLRREAGSGKPTILIYPNPTTGLITLDGAPERTLQTRVFDPTGRLLQTTTARTLDLSGLPPGVYLLDLLDAATGARQRERVVRR